jgi:protein involved in polysaccharide export with SLBB domain
MKKLLSIMILLCITTGVHALSQEQIAQMVSDNPALLETPQAKAYLSSHKGVLPGNIKQTKKVEKNLPEVENDISSTTEIMDDTIQEKQEETLKTDENLLIQKTKEENTLKDGSRRLTPLQYRSDNEEIERIKSVQTPRHHKKLERFSKEFFQNKNKISQKNITTPKDYTLARGDVINFWIYGKTEKNFTLTVNNEGNIDIPEVGPVRVAGERFAEVKELLTNYLSSSYKNSKVVVNLDAFSNAQVTVTGFINAPGIYNTTSVSSVKDILIEAHGVGEVGSVRNIQVRRDGAIIAQIDYYHLLSNGLSHGDLVLKPNDTIHVPRAYGLVSIEGAVYKEAIYEIEPHESLAHILKFAGGLKADADGYSIQVKRYMRNREIQNLTLTMREARNFILRDGDEIYVDGLNVTNDTYVLITGNVVREGKREMNPNGMKLSTLLHNEIRGGKLNSFFLENTRFDYAMIKRIGEDLQVKIFNINLQDILDGESDFLLQNRDELYIFNALDTGTAPYVTIEGKSLIKEGKYIYHDGMTISDLINQAGVKTPYDKSKVKLVSKQDENGKSQVTMIDVESDANYLLHELDRVTLFDLNETHPLQTATISGEVVKAGSYVVSDGITLHDFIESAGGLNEKAYPKECEVIRYHVENGERVKKIFNIPLEKASSFLIQQHDEINIKRIPYWHERKTITLTGEVRFPGTYVIHSGEKLASVIERAGGFTNEAFLYGAIFTRESIRKLQKESLQKELSHLKEQVILVSVRNSSDRRKAPADITGIVAAVDSLIQEAKKAEPKGRITINLDQDFYAFAQSSSNLVLKDKDRLEIPSLNDTIVVNGEVMLPTALTYQGDDIKDYIDRSGGLTHLADAEHIFVIHANGEAERANLGSFLFSSNNVKIKKGDVITVPKEFYIDTRTLDLTKDIAEIFYKLSLTVAAAHTVGAI